MEYTVPEELGGWGKVEKGLQFYGGNDVYYFLGWRRVISSKYNSFPFFSIYLPKVLKQKNQLSLNQSFFKEYFAFCIIITLLSLFFDWIFSSVKAQANTVIFNKDAIYKVFLKIIEKPH